MASTANQVLKQEFILSNQMLFSSTHDGLQPCIGDIVAILKAEPIIGLVTEVISRHRIKVKHQHRAKQDQHIYHPKINSYFQANCSSIICANSWQNR